MKTDDHSTNTVGQEPELQPSCEEDIGKNCKRKLLTPEHIICTLSSLWCFSIINYSSSRGPSLHYDLLLSLLLWSLPKSYQDMLYKFVLRMHTSVSEGWCIVCLPSCLFFQYFPLILLEKKSIDHGGSKSHSMWVRIKPKCFVSSLTRLLISTIFIFIDRLMSAAAKHRGPHFCLENGS